MLAIAGRPQNPKVHRVARGLTNRRSVRSRPRRRGPRSVRVAPSAWACADTKAVIDAKAVVDAEKTTLTPRMSLTPITATRQFLPCRVDAELS